MLKVHHLNNSRSQRIVWLMEELGVEYEIVPYQRDATTNLAPPELKSVHPPRYKDGAMLCTLELKDKFTLFFQDSVDPVTILSAAYDAGVSQAHNYDPSYGRGALGYGHRFGADMAGKASSAFFKDFAYPTIFSEDPRYYRLAHGSFSKRLIYAMSHVVIAHRETDGAPMFNFSE